MFDFLGTFTKSQFNMYTNFIESIDGGLSHIPERIEHLGAEKSRVQEFETYMTAIESRRMAGTLLRWKEEPTMPTPNMLVRGARIDQEPSLFMLSMKWVWHALLWHKKDAATYNLFKAKDRGWQFQEEISDVNETKSQWSAWKSTIIQMLGQADHSWVGTKMYRCLTHKNDDPAKY